MVEENHDLNLSATIDTTVDFKKSTNIETHIGNLKDKIQTRIKDSFESLPEISETDEALPEYIKNYPQSLIFVPEKEMNMFPVVIEEAKNFAEKFDNEHKLDEIRDHEFQHLQKTYELGVDADGIGFVMRKIDGKPDFQGFVFCPDDEEISLKNKLRLLLAPDVSVLSVGDIMDSARTVLDALGKTEESTEAAAVVSDAMYVVSERYLPKNVHSLLQKADLVK